MSDYSKITNFLSKDSLALNDPAKYVKGSEIDAEFNAIATAVATKANSDSPTITGTITAAIANFSGLVTAALGLTVSGAAFNSRGITDSATAKALTLSGSGANSITIANSATNPTIAASSGRINSTSGFSVSGGNSTAADVASSRIQFKSNAVLYVDHTQSADARVVEGVFGSGNFLLRYVDDAYTDSATIIAAAGTSARVTSVGLCYDTNDSPALNIISVASQSNYVIVTASNGGNPKLSTNAGSIDIGSATVFTGQTVGTTVGAAGGASALPATPLGYLTTSINGTACKIPYYVV